MKKQQGFTLIELIAVIILLGILAAVAVPRYMSINDASMETDIKFALGAAKNGFDLHVAQYALDNKYAPPNFAAVSDAPTEIGDFTVSYSYRSSDDRLIIQVVGSTLDWFDDAGCSSESYSSKTYPLGF